MPRIANVDAFAEAGTGKAGEASEQEEEKEKQNKLEAEVRNGK
jgi:hypothetical protein